MNNIKEAKDVIRRKIWETMERKGIAAFPRPVYGRIPNFIGADVAARNLFKLKFIIEAKTFKVNPDSPQRPVRELILKMGKKLLMPTPKLKGGFLLLDPSKIPKSEIRKASTIRGAFIYGEPVKLSQIPKIDVVIVGSVAVSREGYRIGKGGGYSELEYAILREVRAINDDTPVLTTIHEVQLIDEVPHEDHDVPVDYIVTPRRVIEITPRKPKPGGIIWSKITSEMMSNMPILIELKNYCKNQVKNRRH
ncbi:MAG: 5-formyltetrahydrofolate cyclo-ligase [Candidatus Methanomethylicota archaeon]|uniref:5-formyltetrahydrofolate cyclo-ligase n=1 Tax=Thermoproteota archaeon TaxID=2056631 RepID=A0A497F4C6_9CREN|nr:MAG: 5-formyltetrahydrofolate cyclo-ligase [Candidatus Verstraetearchaeota archaeon]